MRGMPSEAAELRGSDWQLWMEQRGALRHPDDTVLPQTGALQWR